MKNYELFDLSAPEISQEHITGVNDTQCIYNPVAQQRAVYAAYQDAIIKSETLRSEITKGIQTREDPIDILLKAIECISLITGDKVFYALNEKNVKMTYRSDKSNAE